MDPKTIQTYNRLAKEYDEETADFWEKFPKTFINAFTKLARGKVLDIGSGPGRDGKILKDAGVPMLCLDASEEMVKLSREKGLESVVGDFMNLPFPDESLQGVWAYTSLLHIPKREIESALAEIRRVLTPEGILGLGMIEGETERYKDDLKDIRTDAPRWFSYYKKEELDDLLKTGGFEVLYFERFKPGTKNYLNFIAKKL